MREAAMNQDGMQRIGLISDTHGLPRPQALAFLDGCDRIIHAGDICDRAVLDALADIAPLVAVRGNNDRGDWARSIEPATTIVVDDVTVHVIHDVADLDRMPLPAAVGVVVHGHSHQPSIVERGSVVFVNPGSAGPRRFRLPVSIGELLIDGSRAEARLVTLMA